MKTKLISSFFLLCSMALFSTEIMKLSEIKAGMEGEGKTIFKGTNIETFGFKILGIIQNFVPSKNLILAELQSPELKDGGVVSGMSGSPAYIGGRLIGSVSYGFTFSRRPIAGITPIEDILKTSEYEAPQYSVKITNIKVDFSEENVRSIGEKLRSELMRRLTPFKNSQLLPIQLISSARGLRQDELSRFLPACAPIQDLKISPDLSKTKLKEDLFHLEPADAVSIPLVRGDFEYAASGTVTHVDGKNVYIFGHPFFNLGSVDFPLHKAEVISVVPALDTSFRVVSTKNMVGVVHQDRFSAVQGELGKSPYMIPTNIFIKNRNRSFKLEMVDHPLLTPGLMQITLMSIFSSEFKEAGFQSLEVEGKIFVENEENVVISNLFSGTSSFEEFANLILAIDFYLMNNSEKKIKIQKMDFEINAIEKEQRTELENVILEKNEFAPGELIKANLFFRNELGLTYSDSVTLKAPNLEPGSSFYILVGDAASIVDFDNRAVKSEFFPNRVSLLIRAINNLRKNNRLYMKMFVPTEGIFIRGFEYPNLPVSVRNVLDFNSNSPEKGSISVSTLAEFQLEVPGVMNGKKTFKLRIKERNHEN